MQRKEMIHGIYEWKKNIGNGSYGKVALVNYKGAEYALKTIRKQQFNAEEESTLKKLQNHENIAQLIEVDQRDNFVVLVLEYCNRGTVTNYQQTLPNKVFTEQEAIKSLYQIVLGIDFIHRQGFLHRDIKPDNILIHEVDGRLIFKLSDFGFSTAKSLTKTGLGTLHFLAPEILKLNQVEGYKKSIDVWSTAVSLFFMLTHQYPFKKVGKEQSHEQILQQIFKRKSFSYQKQTGSKHENLNDLFKRMFQIDPKKRITISQILNHSIFNGLRLNKKQSVASSKTTSSSPDKQNKQVKQQKQVKPETTKFPQTSQIPQISQTPLTHQIPSKTTQIPSKTTEIQNFEQQRPNKPMIKKQSLPNPEQKFPLKPAPQNIQLLLTFQREKNSVLIYILDDLKKASQRFNEIHLTTIVYNVLKLYIIEQRKILLKLQDLKASGYQFSEKLKELLQNVNTQIKNAEAKYMRYYEKCYKIRNYIAQQYKTPLEKLVISPQIHETELDGSFKLFYRLSTSYCYENIKGVTEGTSNQKDYLFLKVFICHSFNKLFTNNKFVIEQYYKWISPETVFKASLFYKWMNNDSSKNIIGGFERIKAQWFRE